MVGDPECVEAAKNTSWRAREVRAPAGPASEDVKHQKKQEAEDTHNDSESGDGALLRF